MTINEYIDRLAAALNGCDRDEVENVLQYYTEILEDADDPEEQMASFGTPEQLAASIRRENGWQPSGYAAYSQPQYAPQPPRKGISAGRVIALVFTSPFWMTAYILIAVLAIVMWTVYICFPFVAAAGAVLGFELLGMYIPYAVEVFAAALLLAGISVLLFRPVMSATKGIGSMFGGFSKFLFSIQKHSRAPRVKKPLCRPALFAGSGLLAAGVVFSLATVVMHPTEKAFAEKLGLENYSCEFTADIENLDVSIKDLGEIKILPSGDGKARLEVENADMDMLEIRDGETCGITYSYEDKGIGERFFMGSNFLNVRYPRAKFILYIPTQEYGDISVDVSIGDLNFDGVTSSNLDLKSNVGKISVKNCTTGKLNVVANLGDIYVEKTVFDGENSNIKADCGNISMKDVTGGNTTFNQSLGDITIADSTFTELSAYNDCGDIEMDNVIVSGRLKTEISLGAADLSNVEAASVTADLDCGDFDFDGAIGGEDGSDSEIELSLGAAEINLRGENYSVLADTDLGEVNINGKSPSKSRLNGNNVISISNDNGDIDVYTGVS